MKQRGSTVEYTVRVLIYAAAYAAVASLLFPDEQTVLGLVVKGLITGAIAQYLDDWRERRVGEGKTPYHPELRIWAGASGLGLAAWCFTHHDRDDPWFFLVLYAGLAAFSLWAIVHAVRESRRATPANPAS